MTIGGCLGSPNTRTCFLIKDHAVEHTRGRVFPLYVRVRVGVLGVSHRRQGKPVEFMVGRIEHILRNGAGVDVDGVSVVQFRGVDDAVVRVVLPDVVLGVCARCKRDGRPIRRWT